MGDMSSSGEVDGDGTSDVSGERVAALPCSLFLVPCLFSPDWIIPTRIFHEERGPEVFDMGLMCILACSAWC